MAGGSFGDATFGSGTFGGYGLDLEGEDLLLDLEDAVSRPFASAQAQLEGPPTRMIGPVQGGWYDSGAYPEVTAGAAAIVHRGGVLEELVGEVVSVRYRGRRIYVYVHGAADLPTDFALTRQAFLAIGNLAVESAPLELEVIG
jgi:hypothetical protein